MLKLASLMGLLAIILDCSRQARSGSQSEAPAAKSETKKDLYVRIQRTPCYGRCPIDQVEAFGDGTVRYTGERFVPRLGVYQRRLTPAELDKLDQLLRKSDFEKYDTLYDNPGISDLPSVVIAYRWNGQAKSITCRTGCPPDLPEKVERIRAFLAEEGNFQMEKGPENEEMLQDSKD